MSSVINRMIADLENIQHLPLKTLNVGGHNIKDSDEQVKKLLARGVRVLTGQSKFH